jgi:hypothetical protein
LSAIGATWSNMEQEKSRNSRNSRRNRGEIVESKLFFRRSALDGPDVFLILVSESWDSTALIMKMQIQVLICSEIMSKPLVTVGHRWSVTKGMPFHR